MGRVLREGCSDAATQHAIALIAQLVGKQAKIRVIPYSFAAVPTRNHPHLIMNHFKHFLDKLLSSIETHQSADEHYLAQSVDACDFERRVRELELRGSHTQDWTWADVARNQTERHSW